MRTLTSHAAQLMRYASAATNDFVARRLKDQAPYIYVAEFPRSGANWLRDIMGDCLQVPVPRFSLLPVTFNAILQTHTARPILGPKVLYLVRDGRDVLVSHYYKVVNGYLGSSPAVSQRALKRHPCLRGGGPEELRAGTKLNEFYQEWRVRSLGSRESWGKHVLAWLEAEHPQCLVVRYEDLHSDPQRTLSSILAHLGAADIPDYVADFALRRNSFEAKTGRRPGAVDNASNRRSGRPGAWREELSEELKHQLWSDFGPVLRRCGYDE